MTTTQRTKEASTACACLHLIDTGGPGGAETVFSQMAQRLNGAPLRSVVVVPREGWLSAKLRSQGIEPHVVDVRGSFNFSYLRKLLAIAKKHNVGLVHSHLLGSSVYGAVLGALIRVPVISVFHGPSDVKSPGRFAALKRWILQHLCAKRIAVSVGTKQALIDFGLAESEIDVIPNGIDTKAFVPERGDDLRQELGLEPDDVLIGAVGNIRAPKAYDVLLRAAAIVLAKAPRTYFVVAGEGNEQAMKPLLELQQSLAIDRFRFLGFRKTTPALLGNFDMFVSSSRSEGLPLSFLEAMASGLSVVATRSGGAQEVIDPERSGLLVPIEDPPALAAAIQRLIDDPQLRRALAERGRETVLRDFNLDSSMQLYAKLHKELLDDRGVS